MAFRVVGLDQVQLAMPPGGEAAARGCYGGVLGLMEAPKPAALAPRGGCWFEGAGAVVHLGVGAEFMPARKAHPALCVTDFTACRQALAAAGAPSWPSECD